MWVFHTDFQICGGFSPFGKTQHVPHLLLPTATTRHLLLSLTQSYSKKFQIKLYPVQNGTQFTAYANCDNHLCLYVFPPPAMSSVTSSSVGLKWGDDWATCFMPWEDLGLVYSSFEVIIHLDHEAPSSELCSMLKSEDKDQRTSEFTQPLPAEVTSSINTSDPVSVADAHAHAIILPLSCLTDDVVCIRLSAFFFLPILFFSHRHLVWINLGFICQKKILFQEWAGG